jgi:exodeoxyribonuclease V alpha subunit
MSIKFGDKQLEAIKLSSLGYKALIIAGYAGTGKTTVSKAILKMYEHRFGYDNIACCALLGVAAARIKKQSGYKATTVHTLLGYGQGKEGEIYLYNDKNPLPYSVF